MKILKENKEEVMTGTEQVAETKPATEPLPVEFITTFVSDCWTKIGDLKAQLAGIKECFTGSEGIEPILSDLMDTYLICVGRAEALLSADKMLDMPISEEPVEEQAPVVSVSAPVVINEPATEEAEPVIATEFNEVDFDSFDTDSFDAPVKPEAAEIEEFEYFTDFDEPVGEKLTDSDLYDEEEIK